MTKEDVGMTVLHGSLFCTGLYGSRLAGRPPFSLQSLNVLISVGKPVF